MGIELPLILRQAKGAEKRDVEVLEPPIEPSPPATMQLAIIDRGDGSAPNRQTELIGSFDRAFRKLQSFTAAQDTPGIEYRAYFSYQGSTGLYVWQTGDDAPVGDGYDCTLSIGPDWPVRQTHSLEIAYRHLIYKLTELWK